MKATRKAMVSLGCISLAMTALTACSSSSDEPSTPPSTESTNQVPPAEDPTTPADPGADVTTVNLWGWAPGYETAVKAFNASHSDIQIAYESVSPGSQGGYDKMLTAVTAGNAPCLGQVGYETFTSFVAAGALEDITSYVTSARAEFADWIWNQVGIRGKVFGIPVDIGPMGLFYRADVFDELGIAVPTTWDEFRTAAEKIHQADPKKYIASLPTDAYNYSGYAWQAGASWFDTADDAWSITINSEANKKIAQFWQGLVDDDLVATYPSWDAALYSAWADGSVVSEVGAVWTSALLRDNAADSSGKWKVAPMPLWPGSDAVGNVGGGSTAVLKGCATPEAAAQAALWLSTADQAVTAFIEEGGMYPASNAGLASPALKATDPFFSDQAIFDIFADATTKVNTAWQWGPVMPVTSSALADGLGAVGAKTGTISDALDGTAEKTVTEIKAQGYAVKD